MDHRSNAIVEYVQARLFRAVRVKVGVSSTMAGLDTHAYVPNSTADFHWGSPSSSTCRCGRLGLLGLKVRCAPK